MGEKKRRVIREGSSLRLASTISQPTSAFAPSFSLSATHSPSCVSAWAPLPQRGSAGRVGVVFAGASTQYCFGQRQ